jgi:chaperone required for assembly of F1-ATPase
LGSICATAILSKTDSPLAELTVLRYLSFGRSITWRILLGSRVVTISVVTPLQDEDDLWNENEDWEVEEWGDEWDDFNDEGDW